MMGCNRIKANYIPSLESVLSITNYIPLLQLQRCSSSRLSAIQTGLQWCFSPGDKARSDFALLAPLCPPWLFRSVNANATEV